MRTVSLILGKVMGQLIQELCITIQKDQIQIASSSAGLQEIDFIGVFLFFTEIAHQLNKGDNVGMLHLDFCEAHCFDLVGRMI